MLHDLSVKVARQCRGGHREKLKQELKTSKPSVIKRKLYDNPERDKGAINQQNFYEVLSNKILGNIRQEVNKLNMHIRNFGLFLINNLDYYRHLMSKIGTRIPFWI